MFLVPFNKIVHLLGRWLDKKLLYGMLTGIKKVIVRVLANITVVDIWDFLIRRPS